MAQAILVQGSNSTSWHSVPHVMALFSSKGPFLQHTSWHIKPVSTERRRSFDPALYRSPVVAPVMGVALYSHARSRELPLAERRKKSNRRPLNSNKTPLSPDQKKQIVSHAPTNIAKSGQSRYRSPQAAVFRQKIPKSRSPKQLLELVCDARRLDQMDTSVIAVAYKRCGNGQWWDTL